MSTLPFSRGLILQMRCCRYFVYLSLVSGQVYSAYLLLEPLAAWFPLLIVIPALVHLSLQCSMRWIYRAHLTEAFLLPCFLLLAGASVEVVLCAVVSIVVCSALLWGGFSGPVMVAFGMGGMAGWLHSDWLMTMADWPHIAWYVSFYLVLLILLIGTIAQRRTAHLAIGDVRLKKQNAMLRRYLPDDLWIHPQLDRRSERTWMTIVFIDLCEFTQAVDSLSPELTEEFLNTFFASVAQPVHAHEGSMHKFLGDGVLCVFKATSAAQRRLTAERSVQAAHTILRTLRRLNLDWEARGLPRPIDASVGIASGFCTVGDWGTPERMDYTVVGGPVNLASRLQEQAPASAVFLDQTTAGLLGRHRCDALASLSIRGLGATPVFVPLPG